MEITELETAILKSGSRITNKLVMGDNYIIDFIHPSIDTNMEYIEKKYDSDDISMYFTSSVSYNKKQNTISTTFRRRIHAFEIDEFDIRACCDIEDKKPTFTCRPHIQLETQTLSVEAEFRTNPITRFQKLINNL